MNHQSNCCKATVKVVGDTTKHYECRNCEKPCDTQETHEAEMRKNIPVGFLRQWINEDRTHGKQEMVSDEDIMGFIEIGYNHPEEHLPDRDLNSDKSL